MGIELGALSACTREVIAVRCVVTTSCEGVHVVQSPNDGNFGIQGAKEVPWVQKTSHPVDVGYIGSGGHAAGFSAVLGAAIGEDGAAWD